MTTLTHPSPDVEAGKEPAKRWRNRWRVIQRTMKVPCAACTCGHVREVYDEGREYLGCLLFTSEAEAMESAANSMLADTLTGKVFEVYLGPEPA